jgi:hypothetical protein
MLKAILRQYVIPALVLLVFLFTLVVVSIRSFLPGDMAQPAPREGLDSSPLASLTRESNL